ncbi:MAG: hypothetical protein HY897_10660 [Deltaproteobacteria bacterium]|nr:hypothetical protein [Deltaproteobacteria bacterium]
MTEGVQTLEATLAAEASRPRRRLSKVAGASMFTSFVPWVVSISGYGIAWFHGAHFFYEFRGLCGATGWTFFELTGYAYALSVACGFLSGFLGTTWVLAKRKHVYGLGYCVAAIVLSAIAVVALAPPSVVCVLDRAGHLLFP